MRFFIPLVLVVIAFQKGYQASDSVGSTLVAEKLEYLEKLLEKSQNETIRLEKQNRQILKLVDRIYHRTVPIQFCDVEKESGRYTIEVKGNAFEVVCEQNMYGGGWIVIHNRFDGSVDFYRDWHDHENGFGNLDGEFSLGLRNVHLLTSTRDYELLVHLEDFNGTVAYARYGKFEIGNRKEYYKLKPLEWYKGTAGDALSYSSDNSFSTRDWDNDDWMGGKCAQDRHGAWWHAHCARCNLNGIYQNTEDKQSMHWDNFRGKRGLKASKMLIREL